MHIVFCIIMLMQITTTATAGIGPESFEEGFSDLDVPVEEDDDWLDSFDLEQSTIIDELLLNEPNFPDDVLLDAEFSPLNVSS